MNILVGTDGRPHSEKAVSYSYHLAAAFDANLYVLYVVNAKSGEDKDKSIKNGMRVLGRAKIKAAEMEIDISTLLEAGDPKETIVDASERINSDLVVVGDSGRKRGFLSKFSNGGTTQNVVKNAGCTVVIVK